MTTVITTYRDSHCIGWHTHYGAEFFGTEKEILDDAFEKEKQDIANRREEKLAEIELKRKALR